VTTRVPLVGITCGTSSLAGQTPRYGANQAYAAAVSAAGGIPVLLVPGSADRSAEILDRLDGLLIPGGADVEPDFYGSERSETVDFTDPARDLLEVEIIRAARRRGLPVFGICRGLQAVNVAFGGTLYQDIPTDLPAALRHQSPAELGRGHLEHDILVEPGSWFADAAGSTSLMVNSLHHQAVREVGEALLVTARSEDGVVEGLETADRQTVAVQCHPEEILDAPWARSLFERFVSVAAG
jgi:putative glutamine amidotransferase